MSLCDYSTPSTGDILRLFNSEKIDKNCHVKDGNLSTITIETAIAQSISQADVDL